MVIIVLNSLGQIQVGLGSTQRERIFIKLK